MITKYKKRNLKSWSSYRRSYLAHEFKKLFDSNSNELFSCVKRIEDYFTNEMFNIEEISFDKELNFIKDFTSKLKDLRK